jgi:hypothetical protein
MLWFRFAGASTLFFVIASSNDLSQSISSYRIHALGGIICALMKHFSFIVQQDKTNLFSIISALLIQVL